MTEAYVNMEVLGAETAPYCNGLEEPWKGLNELHEFPNHKGLIQASSLGVPPHCINSANCR